MFQKIRYALQRFMQGRYGTDKLNTALLILGMNSNKTEDVMAGTLIGFFISCLTFTAGFLLLANLILAKRDVKT